VLGDSKINPETVNDIVLGNVLDPSACYKVRVAALAAGFPVTTSSMAVNRFCSSGLMAVKTIAESIMSGSINVGLAVGAESMSLSPDKGAGTMAGSVSSHPLAVDAMQPMGWTSENVAKDFNISREKHDYYAAKSFQRAEEAQKNGWFEEEIVPVTTTVKDPKTGEEKKVILTTDDGIRYGTTEESLAKIRKAFPQWGISATTGGNASQITDGAGAVLLMRRSTAEKLGQPIIAKYVHSVVVGLEPRIMGIGPSFAIPKLLNDLGVRKEDIDAFEINEAFASMLAYTVEKLGLDHEKVNPNGGAIAFGHPLGATGARQVATGLAYLRRTKQKTLVTSMCIGARFHLLL
jgi:acetyl-CoA acyltransferase 1